VAPAGVEDPVVVVLTPGMYNSAYFEHAFLAQQMGVELVEGNDLFVEEDTVWMRTTRARAAWTSSTGASTTTSSTPLGFRNDSALGVPGLLSVYRSGRVTLANAIGTGIADDKSIYPYVPDMIRFYLGEEPILSNVPTWQCRKPDELSHVLANLERWWSRRCTAPAATGCWWGRRPPATSASASRRCCAPGPTTTSRSPRCRCRPARLRRERHRAAPHRPAALRAVRRRDLDRAGRAVPRGAARGLAGGQFQPGRRHQGHLGPGGLNDMLSRTADDLYWMARYTERAENTARMLDVNWQMSLLPQPAALARDSWAAMLAISELTPHYLARHDAIEAREVLEYMVRDPSNTSSIVACLHRARENARAVRGSITTEVWETLNTTWLEVQRLIGSGQHLRDPSQFFEWVKFRSHLSRGVTIGTMLRDEALHFTRLGTFLERPTTPRGCWA
jgi:hypothetical protein